MTQADTIPFSEGGAGRRPPRRAMVAMSGGVDSSVAALLLRRQGVEVVGVTMCLGVSGPDAGPAVCCGPRAINDARRVCDKLDMPHYVFDYGGQLRDTVIADFVSEYQRGRTPNPCVLCNKRLKFGSLLDKARAMGFGFLATGHYAGIEWIGGSPALVRPLDASKDQTYFLYAMARSCLASVLFPLAGLTKAEVRQLAADGGLPVADKPESQDICFTLAGDYRRFLEGRTRHDRPGDFVHVNGTVLGRHRGISNYTVGQRRGLGIAHGAPLYVAAIDVEENRVILGEKGDLLKRELVATGVNRLVDALPPRAQAQIRYTHKPSECEIVDQGDSLSVRFDEAQEAVTPGQSVVLYAGKVVLGGGVIESAAG